MTNFININGIIKHIMTVTNIITVNKTMFSTYNYTNNSVNHMRQFLSNELILYRMYIFILLL